MFRHFETSSWSENFFRYGSACSDEHRLALARGTREEDDDLPFFEVFNRHTGRRAVIVSEYDRTFGYQRLFLVVFGHLVTGTLNACAQSLETLLSA